MRARLSLALVFLAACGSGLQPSGPIPPLTTATAVAPAPVPPSPAAPAALVVNTDAQRFADVRDRYLAHRMEIAPGWARSLGLHEYDGKIADHSKAGIQGRIAWLEQTLADVKGIDRAKLSPDDALDLALIQRSIEEGLFGLVDRDEWQKNPRFYGGIFDVSDYVDRPYAPLEHRMKKLVEHEEAALKQIDTVRDNLVLPLSKPIAHVGAKSFEGYAVYLRTTVLDTFAKTGDADLRARFTMATNKLADEADRIAKWLKHDVEPKGDDSHVLGKDKYMKLLAVQEGLSMSLEDFKKLGEENLRANEKAYEELAAKGVKLTRPKPSEYLDAGRKELAEARKFVIDHHIVTLPSDDDAVVRETPPYERWNSASLEASGPFDATKTAFFNLTLPDPSLPKKEQDDYVAPFAVLRTTAVHEVYPGHFVQGRWQDRAPTKIQKIMGSYSFVEGWAHYTEQMMLEEGFGADNPENRLGQLSDALLRNCRYVVSIGIHTEGMSVEQAEKRFMDDCKIDKANAHEQAVRGTFDPGYFAYTLGKLQIYALRAEAKQKLGDKFSLQKFHDALLAHGAPTVALLHDRVLADLGAR